jgi:hypothetical protein
MQWYQSRIDHGAPAHNQNFAQDFTEILFLTNHTANSYQQEYYCHVTHAEASTDIGKHQIHPFDSHTAQADHPRLKDDNQAQSKACSKANEQPQRRQNDRPLHIPPHVHKFEIHKLVLHKHKNLSNAPQHHKVRPLPHHNHKPQDFTTIDYRKYNPKPQSHRVPTPKIPIKYKLA